MQFAQLSTLLAAFALVACGPNANTATASGSATPIPDLSGIWARASVEFEPSASGPGPVTNKARLPSGQSNLDQVVGDYSNPILKPAVLDPDETHSGLQIDFTVEDDAVFNTPWSARVTFRHGANEWIEDVCAENMHEYYSNSMVPTDDTPDF